MGLPAPKNPIADPKTGTVTVEWLTWLQDLADARVTTTTPPPVPNTPTPTPPSGGGGGGGGGGNVIINNDYGTGTPGKITKWIAAQQLGDSILTESGETIAVAGDVVARSFTGQLPLHHATHEAGGVDAIKLDAVAAPDDTTTLDATAARHGLLPKLSGTSTEVLSGDGSWIPATTAHPYVDLPEGTYGSPAADVIRLSSLDDNGYTQPLLTDSAGRVACPLRDNLIVAKMTGTSVSAGQPVYLVGASGATPLIALARADTVATLPAIGLALDAGAVNAFVRVLLQGVIGQLDTSGFAEGASVFVSDVTAGVLTTVMPIAPSYVQRIGVVTRSDAAQGAILVLLTIANAGAPMELHHAQHETGGFDALAALDATVFLTGTIPDARISSAIVRIASPAFTGLAPTVPLAAVGTNTTQIASTAFVYGAVPTAPYTLLDAPMVNLDVSQRALYYRLVAAGDRFLGIAGTPTLGQQIIIQHVASGADRTLTLTTTSLGVSFRFGTTIPGLTATLAGKTDYIGCIYAEANSGGGLGWWEVVAYTKGS